MPAPSDYDLGRAQGRQDYRTGRDYTPEPGSPEWRTGYADGWTHAADEATDAVGHAEACWLAWGEGIANHQPPHPDPHTKSRTQPTSIGHGDTVELLLTNGQRIQTPAVIASRVRGVDPDGDLLVPLLGPDSPPQRDNHVEYLIPLTPCCHASGRGAESRTDLVCRRCHREVAARYGGPGQLDTAVSDSHRSP